MTEKQINSEIEYRMAKWVAFNLLQQGMIYTEEYEKACSDFLLRFNPPTSCFENNGDKKD